MWSACMECSRRKRSCGKRASSPTKRKRSRLTQFSRLLLYIRNFPCVRRNVVAFPLHRFPLPPPPPPFIWGRFAWRPPLPVSLDWNYRTLVVLIVTYLSLLKYTTAEITHVWFLSPSPILSRNLGNRNWTSQLEVLTQRPQPPECCSYWCFCLRQACPTVMRNQRYCS